MTNNKLLRKEMKTRRNLLSKEEIDLKSREISDNLSNCCNSLDCKVFLCYYPTGSEVDLLHFYQKLLDNDKKLYFPVSNILDHTLSFYQVFDLTEDFIPGAYGIMEPKASSERKLTSFEEKIICITPGLVFDNSCNRIGYGGGFYDRFFASHNDLLKIAVAYDFQLVDFIKPDKYDIALDAIVCQSKIIKRMQ